MPPPTALLINIRAGEDGVSLAVHQAQRGGCANQPLLGVREAGVVIRLAADRGVVGLSVQIGLLADEARDAVDPQERADLLAAAHVERAELVAFLVACRTAYADERIDHRPAIGQNIPAIGAKRLEPTREIVRAVADAAIGVELDRLERADFRAEFHIVAVDLAVGDQVDHAGQRVRAVEARLRPTKNLDPRDVAGQKRREIRLALIRARDVDAIQQDERVVALGAADAHLGEATGRAGPVDRQTRHLTQNVGHVNIAAILDLLFADGREGGADLLVFGRGCRTRHHHDVALALDRRGLGEGGRSGCNNPERKRQRQGGNLPRSRWTGLSPLLKTTVMIRSPR